MACIQIEDIFFKSGCAVIAVVDYNLRVYGVDGFDALDALIVDIGQD